MKRIIAALVICLLVLAGSAYAAESFTHFTMYFKGMNTYDEVVTDTTSKLKSSGTYSRLYLTSNTSSVNCVWMTHDVTAGRTCSICIQFSEIATCFREILQWGKMKQRRERLQPSAPNFCSNKHRPTHTILQNSSRNPLPQGLSASEGKKNSLPELYQFLVGILAPLLEIDTIRRKGRGGKIRRGTPPFLPPPG